MADSEQATDKNFSGLLKVFPCGKENNEEQTEKTLKDVVTKYFPANENPSFKTKGRE